MSEERTPEAVATEIRDAVDDLNRMLREAATLGFNVEIEALRIDVIDVKQKAARVTLHGVFRRVEPAPRPIQAPPRTKRGNHHHQ